YERAEYAERSRMRNARTVSHLAKVSTSSVERNASRISNALDNTGIMYFSAIAAIRSALSAVGSARARGRREDEAVELLLGALGHLRDQLDQGADMHISESAKRLFISSIARGRCALLG